MTVDNELWKTVPNKPYIKVSNLGRAKSLTRNTIRRNGRKYVTKGRVLKVRLSGHKKASAFISVRPYGGLLLGRLILETFVGPCPKGMECCHWDGNPLNNRLDNLRWDTHKANMADAVRHGKASGPKGEKCHLSKLTREQVIIIRKTYKKGVYGYRRLAHEYNVTHQCIESIVTRKTWNHL